MDDLLTELNFYACSGWIESSNQWITMIKESGNKEKITVSEVRDYITRRLSPLPANVLDILHSLPTIDEISAFIRGYLNRFRVKKISFPILLNVAKYNKSYTLFFDENTIINTVVDAAVNFSDGDDVYPVFSISPSKRDGFLTLDICYKLIC